MSEELLVLKDIASKLNGANFSYMLSGSVAMSYYAQPRNTRDIDIVVTINEKDVKRFVDLFAGNFYIEEESVLSEVKRHGMFNIIHNEYIIKADFIVLGEGSYDKISFERRRNVDIEGVQIAIISPEDLILRKLMWAMDCDSELQMRDVKNMRQMCDDLDESYLDNWIGNLNLSDVYLKALR
jgi:hypothetical protein